MTARVGASGGAGMSEDLDETDRTLLRLLQADGQRSMADLSKEIGIAASTLNDRVKRLAAARRDHRLCIHMSRLRAWGSR